MPTAEHDQWILTTFGVNMRAHRSPPNPGGGVIAGFKRAREQLLAGKQAVVTTLGAAGGRERQAWAGAMRDAKRDWAVTGVKHSRLRAAEDLLKGGSDMLREGWRADKVAAGQGARRVDAAERDAGGALGQGYDRAMPRVAASVGRVAGVKAEAATLRAGQAMGRTGRSGAEYAEEVQNTVVPGVAQLGSGMVDMGVSAARLAADAPYRHDVSQAVQRAKATLAPKWQAGVAEIRRDPAGSARTVRTGTMALLDRTKAAARTGWNHEVDEGLAAQRGGHLARFEAHLVGKAFVAAVGFAKSGAAKLGRVAVNSTRVEVKAAQVEQEAGAGEGAADAAVRARQAAVGAAGVRTIKAKAGAARSRVSIRMASDDGLESGETEAAEGAGHDAARREPRAGEPGSPPREPPSEPPVAASPGDEFEPEDQPHRFARPRARATRQDVDKRIKLRGQASAGLAPGSLPANLDTLPANELNRWIDRTSPEQLRDRFASTSGNEPAQSFHAVAAKASPAQLAKLFDALGQNAKLALGDAIAAAPSDETKLGFLADVAGKIKASGNLALPGGTSVRGGPEAHAAAKVLASLRGKAADQGFALLQGQGASGTPIHAVMDAALDYKTFNVASADPIAIAPQYTSTGIAKLLEAAGSGEQASTKAGAFQATTSLIDKLNASEVQVFPFLGGTAHDETGEIAHALSRLLGADPGPIVDELKQQDPRGASLATYCKTALRKGEPTALARTADKLVQDPVPEALGPEEKLALGDIVAAHGAPGTKVAFVQNLAGKATTTAQARPSFFGMKRSRAVASTEAHAVAKVLATLQGADADAAFGALSGQGAAGAAPLDAVLHATVTAAAPAPGLPGRSAFAASPGTRVATLLQNAGTGADPQMKETVFKSAASLLKRRGVPGSGLAKLDVKSTGKIAGGLTRLLGSDIAAIVQRLQSSEPKGESLSAYIGEMLRTGDVTELSHLADGFVRSRPPAQGRRRAEALGYFAGSLQQGIEPGRKHLQASANRLLKEHAIDPDDFRARPTNEINALSPLTALLRHATQGAGQTGSDVHTVLDAIHDQGSGNDSGDVPAMKRFMDAYRSVAPKSTQ